MPRAVLKKKIIFISLPQPHCDGLLLRREPSAINDLIPSDNSSINICKSQSAYQYNKMFNYYWSQSIQQLNFFVDYLYVVYLKLNADSTTMFQLHSFWETLCKLLTRWSVSQSGYRVQRVPKWEATIGTCRGNLKNENFEKRQMVLRQFNTRIIPQNKLLIVIRFPIFSFRFLRDREI